MIHSRSCSVFGILSRPNRTAKVVLYLFKYFLLSRLNIISICYFSLKPFVKVCDMFRPPNGTVKQAEAPSPHWGCWLIRSVGMHDPRMHRCVARTIAILILDFMKFEVS